MSSSFAPASSPPQSELDLAAFAPVLRRLLSNAPLDDGETFDLGNRSTARLRRGVIDLAGISVPAHIMRAMLDATAANGSITAVLLDRCRLGEKNRAAQVLGALHRHLTTSTWIRALRVRENAWTDAHASRLFRSVIAAPQLQSIGFAKDRLTDKTARMAASVLVESDTLQELALDELAITSTGVRAIAEALGLHNRTLVSLSLAETPLNADAARALANAFERGCALKELRLRDCGIDDGVTSALARGVGVHQELQHLDLRGNAIGDVGVSALADAIGGHASLRRVDLGGGRHLPATPVSTRGAQALAAAIEEGGALEELRVEVDRVESARILLEAVTARGGAAPALDLGPQAGTNQRRRAATVRKTRGTLAFSPAASRWFAL